MHQVFRKTMRSHLPAQEQCLAGISLHNNSCNAQQRIECGCIEVQGAALQTFPCRFNIRLTSQVCAAGARSHTETSEFRCWWRVQRGQHA